MLFDVTTLYFESVEVDELRAFGYSKDHRFNTTQIVLALATNTEGLPIGYEIFKGNTAEVKTLGESIERWRKNFPINDVCFVGDRAMFCKANLDYMDQMGYSYIVAAKLRNMPGTMQQDILDCNNYRGALFGDEIGWVAEFEVNNRRLISSYKTQRARHDAYNRKQILDKVKKVIGDGEKADKLISNNGIKKFTTTDGDSKTTIDKNKIDLDSKWDGMHGVITNIRDKDPVEILASYSRLWVIEESFRINKHNLKMRPIYHWKKERIESHIAICYMSYAVLRNLQYEVNLTQKVSVGDIMDELLNTQASIYRHKLTGDLYRVPGKTSQKASKIYKAMNLLRSQDATIYGI
jgi:transposase